MFLEILQNSQQNACARVSFLIKLQAVACNFIKKETRSQVFSCEFYEISKTTFFTEHLWANASVKLNVKNLNTRSSENRKDETLFARKIVHFIFQGFSVKEHLSMKRIVPLIH